MSRTQRALALVVLVSFGAQTLGCGTILYPERRGQAAGRMDAAVVILDAVGLLFFFVPGVVAFAVDFATGCIYLPGGGRGVASGETPPAVERIPFEGDDLAAAAAAVESRTGVRLAEHEVWVTHGDAGADAALAVARLAGQLDAGAPPSRRWSRFAAARYAASEVFAARTP